MTPALGGSPFFRSFDHQLQPLTHPLPLERSNSGLSNGSFMSSNLAACQALQTISI
jgi:hypothetical protein